MDQLDGIAMFVQAAERGSFALAARDLKVTPSAVSKAVGRLEARLGARLFRRNTRSVALTDEGLVYFERCRAAIGDLQVAEDALLRRGAAPRGLLRVSMPVAFGSRCVAPLLPGFLDRYPEVSVEALSSDRAVDLVGDGFDVAIRTGRLHDSALVARKLMETQLLTCASPDYLAAHGEPRSVDELTGHRTLRYLMPETNRPFAWPFVVEGRDVTYIPTGRLAFNNIDALIRAAEAGAGIVTKQDYMLADSIAAGRLIPILRRFRADGGPISAVYLPSRHLSPRLRAFVDYLAEHLVGDSRRAQVVPS